MLNSFEQVVKYSIENGLTSEYKNRLFAIKENTLAQRWENKKAFEDVLEIFD